MKKDFTRTVFDYLRSVYHHADFKRIKQDCKTYESLNTRKNFSYDKKYKWFIDDSKESAGTCREYYWQDLWAATRIIERKPEVHYDIGSRIDGFIAHLQSAKQKTCLIDIRPLDIDLPYVRFIQADATSLEGIDDNSIDSISALCSLEHFGLGRYGDPIDPEACFKAFKSIQRVTKNKGHIYIAVPIGWEHLEFNAQRVFYAQTIIEEFDECALVDLHVNTMGGENLELHKVSDIHEFDDEKDNGGMRFGLFEFIKK